MNPRNRVFILLGIIFVIAAIYYVFSADHSKDLVLIGTVDANQVIVSAQVEGRIQKLLVDEGTPVKAGDLIAVLDPSELQTQEAAAAATIASLKHKVSETQSTAQSTSGTLSICSMRSPIVPPCDRSIVSQPNEAACASRSLLKSETITTAAPSNIADAAAASPTGPAPDMRTVDPVVTPALTQP